MTFKQKFLYRLPLMLFLIACYVAAGNGRVYNANCSSSPCGGREETVEFHFVGSSNLVFAPGTALLRLLPYEKTVKQIVPFQEVIVFGDDIVVMRALFIGFFLVKLAHIPLWIVYYFLLRRAVLSDRGGIKLFGVLITTMIALLMVFMWAISVNDSYPDVSGRIFFDPKQAFFVAG